MPNSEFASHPRSMHKGRHSTQAEPLAPRVTVSTAEWKAATPLIGWAEQTGPNTPGVISHILERRVHPQSWLTRACLGILRLG